ncbi:MAG: formyltetrahydrofolate deformylase [Acidobacteria bacterium]|nr:MAG: formyltetrahydrofolate deformylase [Acidobacteriota bacterium]PYV71210.1 MAG: formyltetrahydrofolate deformylase [Acidobacteriota bacterium]PYV75427.1 MAG: formyltetrahydrofolate deformylase [Acidobacteriota bacterium]
MKKSAVLLLSCPDRKGIVAAVAGFVAQHGGNILHADEHGDHDSNTFLMRVEFDPAELDLPLSDLVHHFSRIASEFDMQWRLVLSDVRQRMAILVSKYDHCLVDLLYRHQSGELACDIPCVISNHSDSQSIAEFYRIPFYLVPVEKKEKQAAERQIRGLLERQAVDFIVLARYMQILSPEFVSAYPQRIINIHHSFLPAFVGSRPYHQAFERGVKLIGATSHYVTEVLDDGPIIEQDVARVSHRDSVEDLIQKGRDLEKVVLSRAVRWHIENRILLYGNKTVVFE